MTANTNTTETKRQRGRKVAAILAGGLVLGVGTMATLASWNDSEFANATFTAGRFNLVGSTNGTAWDDHPASPGAALNFTLPLSTNLTPNDSVYALFGVRLAQNTTSDANVAISASSGATGSVAHLTYELVKTDTTTCNEATITSADSEDVLVPAGTAVGSAAGAADFGLAKGSPTTAAGAPQYLCFKVTADSDLVQGQSGSGIWQFSATSN